jgi:coenzyme F420-dependent glucose-6-phosphate dehydrogenase
MSDRHGLKFGVDVGENDADPAEFVECALAAEGSGFDSVWFGDHFMPWVHIGGKSAFVWSVMSSALERTERIRIGPDVTCPIGGRFHPAIVAQAAATLDNMYPGRFSLGVGSGEAVNEARFFLEQMGRWPRWSERIERLCEAVALIRQLWSSEGYFTFEGRFFRMADVQLYTRPKTKIPIYFSAMGAKAAIYAGKVGDNLVTVAPPAKCKNTLFPNFEKSLRQEGRNPTEAEKMVLINFVIGDAEESLKKLKSKDACYLTAGAFDEPDPRRIQASGLSLDDEVVKENYYLCHSATELPQVIEAYQEAGASQLVFATGANPELIRRVGKVVFG